MTQGAMIYGLQNIALVRDFVMIRVRFVETLHKAGDLGIRSAKTYKRSYGDASILPTNLRGDTRRCAISRPSVEWCHFIYRPWEDRVL